MNFFTFKRPTVVGFIIVTQMLCVILLVIYGSCYGAFHMFTFTLTYMHLEDAFQSQAISLCVSWKSNPLFINLQNSLQYVKSYTNETLLI